MVAPSDTADETQELDTQPAQVSPTLAKNVQHPISNISFHFALSSVKESIENTATMDGHNDHHTFILEPVTHSSEAGTQSLIDSTEQEKHPIDPLLQRPSFCSYRFL